MLWFLASSHVSAKTACAEEGGRVCAELPGVLLSDQSQANMLARGDQ